MRFVEIETVHGHKHHVNVGQVDYIKPNGEDCILVFGAGAHGLHTLQAKGKAEDVAAQLEQAANAWRGRPATPEFAGFGKGSLDILCAALRGGGSDPRLIDEGEPGEPIRSFENGQMWMPTDDQTREPEEAFDRAAGAMAQAHEQLRELQAREDPTNATMSAMLGAQLHKGDTNQGDANDPGTGQPSTGETGTGETGDPGASEPGTGEDGQTTAPAGYTNGKQTPPETPPAALTRGAPKKKG